MRLAGGEVVNADIVVSNADLVYTYKKLVPAQYRRVYTDAKLDRMDYACSGYLLYLGVDKTLPAHAAPGALLLGGLPGQP